LRGPAALTTGKERPVSTEQKSRPLTAAAEYEKKIYPHRKLSHNSTVIHQVESSPFRVLRTDGLLRIESCARLVRMIRSTTGAGTFEQPND